VDARDIDLVLISHLHLDHLDRRSLTRVGLGVPVVVGTGGAGLIRRWGHQQVIELGVGERWRIGGLTVEATPAVHSGDRPPRGPRGTAVGYLLETPRARLYFAGDTDLFPEMADLGRPGIDTALLPIAGWGPRLGPGHMNPTRAVDAAGLLGARQVLPIHWGTLWPAGMHLVTGNRLTRPAEAFAAELAERQPAVRRLVALPGERVPLR
jgi:L-ascorbate metabolism protein UlaG (beta-lactamase superfamily)